MAQGNHPELTLSNSRALHLFHLAVVVRYPTAMALDPTSNCLFLANSQLGCAARVGGMSRDTLDQGIAHQCSDSFAGLLSIAPATARSVRMDYEIALEGEPHAQPFE